MKFDEDKFKEFEQACLAHIDRLQECIGEHDAVMLDTFCDAVCMVREYSDVMQAPTTSHLRECPACTNKEPDRHTCSLCGHKHYGEEA